MEGVAMCDYCHNIQEWKRFNAPKDYLACIEYIQQLVTNGGFELLEEESTCPLNQVKTEDGWADEIMVHMVWCKVTQKKSMTNVKLLGKLPGIVWIVQHGH